MDKKSRLILSGISLTMGVLAAYLIFDSVGAQTTIGVYLALWANNIGQQLKWERNE